MSVGRRLRIATGRLALRSRLRRSLPPAARQILTALVAAGHEAFLVGGCVRDLLLGVPPKDWDLVTSASPEAILRLFPHGRVMGSARGGNTVMIPAQGEPFEVTPYRGGSLAEDLRRRDFTVNAMALGADGGLHDPLDGQRDLARGVIRACLDARARLGEDPVRMLRAVRLAAQLGAELDPDLAGAISALAPRLAEVAPERIGAEFGRLLVTDRPAWGMQRLRELGLLPHFAPELAAMIGVEQNQYHAYPVWEHALVALAEIEPKLHLRLAALLHDVGKPHTVSVDEAGNRHFYRHEQVGAEIADRFLRRLRFPNEVREKVVHLVRYHMDLHLDGPVSDRAVRRMMQRIGLAHMNDLIQVRRADRIASGMRVGDLSHETIHLLQQMERLLKEDAALKVTDLKVDGHDVVRAFGRPPGPYVGQVLQRLLEEVADDPSLNQRDRLLARLAELSKM